MTTPAAGARLQLRTACTLAPLPEGRVLVRSSGVTMVLHGAAASELLPLLVPLLDGERSGDEIVAALPGFAEGDVRAALATLIANGLVHEPHIEGVDPDDQARYPEQVRFFSGYGLGRVGEARRLLAGATFGVAGAGPIGRELARQLAGAGPAAVRVAVGGEDAEAQPGVEVLDLGVEPGEEALAAFTAGLSFAIVDAGRWRPAVLAGFNRAALAAGLPWMVVRDEGLAASVGPLFVPGETACYACYQGRRRGLEEFIAGYDAWEAVQGTETAGRLGALPGVAALVAGLATVEALKMVTGFEIAAAMGAELRYDLTTSQVEAHPVLKLPRCEACGPSRLHRPEPAVWMTPSP